MIGVTGSVGKTSTKQLIAALIAPHRRVAANPANFNTEIGLPLAVLAAPEGTEVLVLEMGMRGFGQIDELARIAEPDVGVITNIGPVHLELVGGLAGVARAKAELLAHVPVAIIPADVPLLEPYLREGLDVVRFGTDVFLEDFDPPHVRDRRARAAVVELEVPFRARHQLVNLLAAVAAAQAVGVEPEGAVDVEFGALRGEHVELPTGVRRHQRLLQRQPAVHARRARRSRHAGAYGAARGRARRHAGARARASWRRTARSGRTRLVPGLTCWSPSGRCRPPRCPRRSAARSTSRPTPRRRPRSSPASCAPATSCS